MGKKNKSKTEATVAHAVKRKPSVEDEPPAKRKKEDSWFPGKFVLLKPPTTNESTSEPISVNTSSQSSDTTPKTKKKKKNKKKQQQHEEITKLDESSKEIPVNGKSKKTNGEVKVNGKQKSMLQAVYDRQIDESDDEEWMDFSDGPSFESMSDEDEAVGEEWSTDTDYSEGDSLEDSINDLSEGYEENSEYSFHTSDCESVSDVEEPGGCYDSDEDDDYLPDVEDKYIKRGDAVLYEAKGLELAFGNSNESQIMEISDITPAELGGSEEEIPDLIPPDDAESDDGDENPDVMAKESDTTNKEAETLLEHLEIEDSDEKLACSQIGKLASFYDCKDDQGVIVKLSGTIHFHGILIIRALANTVQINGYTLNENEVFTATSISRADYFLNLTPAFTDKYSKEKLSKELEKLLDDNKLGNLLHDFDPVTETIVYLQQGLPDTPMEMLKAYSTNALLPSKKMILENSPCQSSELILAAKFFVGSENQKVCTFQLNEQWINLEVHSVSNILVAGGKNVGKSGLCQFLINDNIKKFGRILLIDLDIGQPICCPAQTLSATLISKPIIGPGYLSQTQPDKSLLFGDKNVMISPFKYIRCVRQLADFCKQNTDYQNIPWIINTMGYQKGLGFQLITLLVKIFQPTDVVQIQHGIKSYNFAKVITQESVNTEKLNFFEAEDVASLPTQAVFTTHVLDSIVNNQDLDIQSKWVSNASEKRKLAMIAQLAKLLKANQSCLNDVVPFVAPISKLRMVVMDEEYEQQQQQLNLDLLNGNLVYLCKADDDSLLNSDVILECFGVGVVRAIDKFNGQIFLLLPQKCNIKSLQSNINVLAIGNIPLPAEILLKQSYSVIGNVPHVTFFKDRNITSKKYVNKRHIKDCF